MDNRTTFRKDGENVEAWVIMPSQKRKNRDFYMFHHALIDYMMKAGVSPAGWNCFIWIARNTGKDLRCRRYKLSHMADECNCSTYKIQSGLTNLVRLGIIDLSEPGWWRINNDVATR